MPEGMWVCECLYCITQTAQCLGGCMLHFCYFERLGACCCITVIFLNIGVCIVHFYDTYQVEKTGWECVWCIRVTFESVVVCIMH